jgi:hypothetical protein
LSGKRYEDNIKTDLNEMRYLFIYFVTYICAEVKKAWSHTSIHPKCFIKRRDNYVFFNLSKLRYPITGSYNTLGENPKEKDHPEDLHVDGKVIPKWMFDKQEQ